MQLISQGAEAKIYKKDNILIKDRIKKTYRISQIDDKLRQSRTRREAKVLEKLQKIGFCSPNLINSDGIEKIEMEFIEGEKVRDILEKSDYSKICKEIGKKVAILHNAEIIHGDLTTSNMILNSKDNKIYFIDFGLSFFSKRFEDKAVDLHLFRQAIESKHHTIWEKCFSAFLNEYKKNADESDEIIERFDVVEMRGRNKTRN